MTDTHASDDIFPILDLSDDCLQYILSMITDAPRDYLKYSRVCRKFHRSNKRNKYTSALKFSEPKNVNQDYRDHHGIYRSIKSIYYCVPSRLHGECYTIRMIRRSCDEPFLKSTAEIEYTYYEFGRLIDKERWKQIGCPNKIPKPLQINITAINNG